MMERNAQRIGMATIGHAPRNDVVPAMRSYLPEGVQIVERGALDGLDYAATRPYWADPGEVGIVTRLHDSSSVLLSHQRILPEMQRVVDELIRIDGADLVVILCGANWSALQAKRLIVNPGTLFPAVIASLAAGRRLGVIKPDAGQVEREHERYAALGIDAVVTAASPYTGPRRLDLAREAAQQLQGADCELVWMTCIGMDAAMRDVVAEITGVPVVLAHALLARIVTELLEGARVEAVI
jgi:protein AroM